MNGTVEESGLYTKSYKYKQKFRNIPNTTIGWLTSRLSYAYNYFMNEFGWKVQPLWY